MSIKTSNGMPILIFNALLRDVPLPILNVTVIVVTSVLAKHSILQPHAAHPACGSVVEQDKA